MKIRIVLAVVGILAIGGCAATRTTSEPAPVADLALGRAAIADAVAAGATEYAPAILIRARDELDHASVAAAEGRHRDARRFAQDAEVDAQLAATTARARQAELALAEADAGARPLREGIPRPR